MFSHHIPWEVGARSETGYVRSENQDRMSGACVPLGQLYIVADGMGGYNGGAVAAALTVQGLQHYIGAAPAHASVEDVIQTAFHQTNATVYRHAHAGDPTTEDMGSTAVLVLIAGRVARVAHVGDSRAYLYRQGQLTPLTTDHTIVQKMVRGGILTQAEIIDHPDASVLERAMGHQPSVDVEISDPLLLLPGDAILLCSDGLSGYVADREIAAILQGQATVQDIPEHLVQLALHTGGEDNVTVQFIQYGTRTEAQLSPPKRLRPVWQLAAALVLGAVISAAGFYAYAHVQRSSLRAEQDAKRAEQDAKNKELEAQKVMVEQPTNAKAETTQKEVPKTKRTTEEAQKQSGTIHARASKSGSGSAEQRTAGTRHKAVIR